ncbi:hypothetical protein [Streptomyces sp. TR02-1]
MTWVVDAAAVLRRAVRAAVALLLVARARCGGTCALMGNIGTT